MAVKKCNKCSKSLLLKSFSKRKASKDGLQSNCKACILGADHDTVINHFKLLWHNRYRTELTNQTYEIHHIVHNQTANNEEELIKLQHYTNLELLTPEDHKTTHRGFPL